LRDSLIAESLGTILKNTQIINLNMHGKPVFPIIMRKVIIRRRKVHSWNEIIESGVNVKPTSLKEVWDVKIALFQTQLDHAHRCEFQ
jgi:hypothetical protein